MIDGNHSRGEDGWKTRGSSRRTFFAVVGSVAVVTTAGCLDGDGGDSNEPIRYLSDRGDSKDVMDEVIVESEEETDHTVETIYTVKGISSDTEMQKMVAAGNLPDLPFDTSTDAYQLQHNGVLVPVTGAVQDNNLPDPVTVDGESYFAAAMVEPLMGWYRNDVYSELPASWSEQAEAVDEVPASESMKGYAVQSGQMNNADTQMTQYLWQNDVEIHDGPSDGIEVRSDDDDNRQAAVETFEWAQSMAEHSPNSSGWAWGDAIDAPQQESTVAIASVGGLPILTIQTNRPDLVENFGPTPSPAPNGVVQDKQWVYMKGHFVRNDGQNTEDAQAFVDLFTSLLRFFDFVLSAPLFQFPPTREQLDAPGVTENEVIQQHPDVMNLVRDNQDALTNVLVTGDDGAPDIVAVDAYGEQLSGQAAGQLLVGGLTPDEAVDRLAEQLHGLQ